jgi:uncharacterized protein YdeI (YjbR/CyaY-like superfamily)
VDERGFASKEEFIAWLEEHHATSDGLWIRIGKKNAGVESVTVTETLDVALCFGWIDGQRKPLDDKYFLQKYTPRRARSKWSKRNVGLVEKLIEAGEMRAAGHAEIERAKADGRWDAAYDSPANIQVPPDLQAELDARPAAAEFFKTLNSTNRYSILYRLHDAKRPETRARRLEQFVAMLERGETPYPQRGAYPRKTPAKKKEPPA